MRNRKRKFIWDFRLEPSRLIPRPSLRESKCHIARSERHWYRLRFSIIHAEKLETWCRSKDISFKVAVDGNLWQFRKGMIHAKWTPTCSHLSYTLNVRSEKWKHGKAHEYEQVIHVLESVFTTNDEIAPVT
jgi:hypothetical protein